MKILIVLIILNLASFYFINNTSIVYTILGITVVMYLLVVNFFRFPNRVIIQDDNTILAPADGKIVVIEETEEPEFFKEESKDDGNVKELLKKAMQAGAEFASKICGVEGAFGYGTPIAGRIIDNRNN